MRQAYCLGGYFTYTVRQAYCLGGYSAHIVRQAYCLGNKGDILLLFVYFSPRGEWAVPGGTARPGQPVEKSEQAPASSPQFKNQFNIDGPQWGPYQILS